MSYQSPVYNVIAVPIEKVKPNIYNLSKVTPPKRHLLYESIKEDGYTMSVVRYYVKVQDLYPTVDGFHCYQVILGYPDTYEREQGFLPVSVIGKPINERMVSTIRHNRVRGTHNVDLMSNIVKELHELGCSDTWTSKHLEMDRDEILRLKQIIGLTILFQDVKLDQVWCPMEDDQDWNDGRQVLWFACVVRLVTDK